MLLISSFCYSLFAENTKLKCFSFFTFKQKQRVMLMSIAVSNVLWEGSATTDELSKDELRLLVELTVATWDPKKLLLKAYLLGCHNRIWGVLGRMLKKTRTTPSLLSQRAGVTRCGRCSCKLKLSSAKLKKKVGYKLTFFFVLSTTLEN